MLSFVLNRHSLYSTLCWFIRVVISTVIVSDHHSRWLPEREPFGSPAGDGESSSGDSPASICGRCFMALFIGFEPCGEV